MLKATIIVANVYMLYTLMCLVITKFSQNVQHNYLIGLHTCLLPLWPPATDIINKSWSLGHGCVDNNRAQL